MTESELIAALKEARTHKSLSEEFRLALIGLKYKMRCAEEGWHCAECTKRNDPPVCVYAQDVRLRA